MSIDLKEYKEKLYSAVIADTLDSLGYHKQVLKPGIKSIDPKIKLCGLARIGLYMPIYHDDETVNVYEHEIALVDSLKENEIAVLCCHGNENIAPWGELLSTRASFLKSGGCLTDGCVRDTDMIRKMQFPVFSKGTNPVDTKFRGKMMMTDVPGEIAGVRIESGDLIFGDNDELSSIVADLIGASLYIILSDIDGVYTSNPKTSNDSRIISTVTNIDNTLLSLSDDNIDSRGTGGIQTKILAAKYATDRHIETVIANGHNSTIIHDVINRKDVGTRFLPKKTI